MNFDHSFPTQFLVYPVNQTPEIEMDRRMQRKRLKDLTMGTEERLVELFFELVYPIFPILNKDKFLNDFHKDNDIENGVLAGVFGICVTWTKYDPVLCLKNMPRQLHDNLLDECDIAIKRTIEKPGLETVQSLLLVMQKRCVDDGKIAMDLSKLVSISYSIGLNIDCRDWNISKGEKECRKRLWWSVYLLEKWCTANLGRPSCLSENNTTWEYEDISQDTNEEIQLFVHLIRLTRILDRVVSKFHTVRGYKANFLNREETVKQVMVFFNELTQWREQLPLKLQNMECQPTEVNPNGILHLCDLTIQVLLHRILLHPSSINMIPRSQLVELRANANKTVQAITKFTSSILNAHLKTFWHTMVRHNFSTLFSFLAFFNLTALTKREFNSSRTLMEKWNKALQGLSKSWDIGTSLAVERGNTVFLAEKNFDDINVPGQQKLYRFTDVSPDKGKRKRSNTSSKPVKVEPMTTSASSSIPLPSQSPIDTVNFENFISQDTSNQALHADDFLINFDEIWKT